MNCASFLIPTTDYSTDSTGNRNGAFLGGVGGVRIGGGGAGFFFVLGGRGAGGPVPAGEPVPEGGPVPAAGRRGVE